MFKHRLKAFILATCAFTVMAPAALAADTTSVAVSGGSLDFTAIPLAGDFAAVTLNGSNQTTTANLDDFQVNDSRGTGDGWKITVQASQFTETSATIDVGANAKTLPTSSLTMGAPRVTADGTTSPLPSITTGPYTLDAGSAVKIASAAVNAGMGKYNFDDGTTAANIPLTLALKPATTYAVTYSSNATITLATAP